MPGLTRESPEKRGQFVLRPREAIPILLGFCDPIV